MEKEFEGNSWMELVRTPGNRHRLLILVTAGLFSQWSGNGLVSYYITLILTNVGVTNPDIQLVINAVLQVVNLIVAVTMCFFVDKVGRRKLFLISTAGMLVVFIIWTICSAQYAMTGSTGAANAVIVMIFLYYVFYNTAWSGLLVGYTVEILPYNIRAKGMTIMFLMVDAALFFNNYANPVAITNIGWKYYIVYVSLCLSESRLENIWLMKPSAAGWLSSSSSSGSSTLRPATRLSRRLLSTSTVTRLWLVVPWLQRRVVNSQLRCMARTQQRRRSLSLSRRRCRPR